MLNDKLKSARAIAKTLRPSEDIVDTSIIRGAELLISIVQARLDTGVAPQVGHGAFRQASAGLASLAQAREHFVACHDELAMTRDDQGLSPAMVGCTIGKPPQASSAAPGEAAANAA